jgi:hypothetical protein
MNYSKVFLSSIVLLVMVLGFSVQAHADLELLGQGTSTHGTWNLIYDKDFNITWYDYTMTPDIWQNQRDWALDLTVNFGVNVYNNWRLPATIDGPYVWGFSGTTTAGYNITSSEMGHLYHVELENDGYFDTSQNPTGCSESSPWCLTNTGDFQNLQPVNYWSGTEYGDDTDKAWYFLFKHGSQSNPTKDSTVHALAVMSGQAVAPEPISSALFLVGAATLGFRRFRKKFKK